MQEFIPNTDLCAGVARHSRLAPGRRFLAPAARRHLPASATAPTSCQDNVSRLIEQTGVVGMLLVFILWVGLLLLLRSDPSLPHALASMHGTLPGVHVVADHPTSPEVGLARGARPPSSPDAP